MTDVEIIDFFKESKGSTCGRFFDAQLHRPITPHVVKKQGHWAWLLSALLLPFAVQTQTPQSVNDLDAVLRRHTEQNIAKDQSGILRKENLLKSIKKRKKKSSR